MSLSNTLRDVDISAAELPSKQDLLGLYRSMLRIRRVEEEIVRLYPTDKIKSPVHLSIGQEAVASGVCENLRADDVVFGTYRGHALYLAKNGSLPRMMAELYGKVTGCGRGKGGSMHLVDESVGMMCTSAIVATSVPHAVGYAYGLKVQQRNSVVGSFFGEGATDEGVFHESINFAALRKLPILFVCENNQFAIYSHVSTRLAGGDLCARVRSYGIPAQRIENNDVFEIHQRSAEALAAIRAGEGPQFLECMTYRWRDHVGPGEDRVFGYRPDHELDQWIRDDPMERLARLIPAGEREVIDREIERELAEAIAFAEDSAFPTDLEIFDHVFASRR